MEIMNWSIKTRRLIFFLMVFVAGGILFFLVFSGNNWIQQHRGLTLALLATGVIALSSIVWMGLVGSGEPYGGALKKTIAFAILIFGLVALLNIFFNIKK